MCIDSLSTSPIYHELRRAIEIAVPRLADYICNLDSSQSSCPPIYWTMLGTAQFPYHRVFVMNTHSIIMTVATGPNHTDDRTGRARKFCLSDPDSLTKLKLELDHVWQGISTIGNKPCSQC